VKCRKKIGVIVKKQEILSHQAADWLNDGQALKGTSDQSRRTFLRNASAAGLLGGYALAAQPIQAQQVIATDFDGIEAGEKSISENGVDLYAYVAKPKSASGALPTVIVCSEIFGVHEHIADIARRFAKQGYMAIAPEFFTRAGDPTTLGTVAEIIKEIVSQTPDAQVMDDIRACLTWAAKNGADPDRAGITGFCWGGRITWLACAQINQMKAGVAWYGRLVGEKSDNFPLHPVDIAKELKAPVLGLYGSADTGIPVSTVEQMQAALKQASTNAAAAKSRFEVYPDAPHAFHADYRDTYRDGPAKDGWQQCLAWFKQNGV
jgi:carboxymethylenebutenolidase